MPQVTVSGRLMISRILNQPACHYGRLNRHVVGLASGWSVVANTPELTVICLCAMVRAHLFRMRGTS